MLIHYCATIINVNISMLCAAGLGHRQWSLAHLKQDLNYVDSISTNLCFSESLKYCASIQPSEPEQGDTEGEVAPSSTSLAEGPEETEPESIPESRVDSTPPGDEPSDQQTANKDTPTDDEQTQ